MVIDIAMCNKSRIILQEMWQEKDYIIKCVEAIYLEGEKIIDAMIVSKDTDTSINLKKKLDCYHGLLTAVKDMLLTTEQQEISESTMREYNVASFPVKLNTKFSMTLSHFKCATQFWLCLANNQAKIALHSLLTQKLQQKRLPVLVDPKPGDLVIASTILGIIRALILEQNEQLRFLLVDIDSGRTVTTKCKLFQLDADILNFHQQAVFCSLDLQDPLLYRSESEVKERLAAGLMTVTFVSAVEKSDSKYVAKWSAMVVTPEVNNNGLMSEDGGAISAADAKIPKPGKRKDEYAALHGSMSTSSATSGSWLLSLKNGEEMDVVASHVESPYEIYVYAANEKTSKAIDRMLEQMQLVYENMKHSAILPKVGDIIAVNCQKYQWTRGKVLSWEKEIGVKVFLIDYGDTISVPESCCADLVAAFQSQPACVQCISLTQIHPLPPHKKWPVNANQELQKIINLKVVRLYVLQESDKHGAAPSVKLTVKNGDEEINVGKLMVESKLATYRPIEDKKVLDSWNPMKEDYHLGHMEDGSVNQAVLGYDPKDEQRACYMFQKTGSCNRLGCQKEHVELHPDGWTADQEEVAVEAYKSLTLPAAGSRCHFKVTQIENINHMFGILTTRMSLGDGTLEDLVEYINQPREHTQTLSTVPGVGQLVLCKEPTQDLLYRARVLEIGDHIDAREVFIRVYYVDYGNTEWTELQNLRMIPQKFLHLPFQAVEFKINDFAAKKQCLLEAKQKLLHLAEKHEISADVVSTRPGECQTWAVIIKNAQINTIPLQEILQEYVAECQVPDPLMCVAEDSVILPG